MIGRKFNFAEGDKEATRMAGLAKLAQLTNKISKLANQQADLVDDEKRWLRKKRLATTKLKNITRAKRNLRKRIKALTNERTDEQ